MTTDDQTAEEDAVEDRQLLDAIGKGETWNVQALLVSGADPNAASADGAAIALAARKSESVMVESLLAAGANVNGRDANGDTALINAVRHGHEDNIDLLLKAGADASLLNTAGESVAYVAEKILENNALNVHSAALDGALRPEEARLLDKWEKLAATLKERYAEDDSVALKHSIHVQKPLKFKLKPA